MMDDQSLNFFNSKFPKVTDVDAFAAEAPLSSVLNVEHKVVGVSAEGRKIHSLRISSGATCGNATTLLLVAGLHAREWITIGGTLCAVDRLIHERAPSSPQLASLQHSIQSGRVALHVVLLANPDGFSYTRTTKRHWRRNRNRPAVDLNRNFGVDKISWGFGTSSNSSELNQGAAPFSEPESRALEKFVESSNGACKPKVLLLDVHCCARVVYPPFLYGKNASTDDARRLQSLGERVAQKSGYKFREREKAFSKSNTGVFIDWAYSEAGLDAAFMLEVRGAPAPKSFRALFRNAPSDQCPVGLEIVSALNALAQSSDARATAPIPRNASKMATPVAANATEYLSVMKIPSIVVYFEATYTAAFGVLIVILCTYKLLCRSRVAARGLVSASK